jgi:general secretion pathway protein J
MRGFTLIEIMVAISMLTIVLFSVYGVFRAVNLTKQRLDADSADYHLARVVFDRLGREIQGAYFSPDDQTTIFHGGINRQGETFLQMTTTAVTPLSRKGTGIARVDYLLAKDDERAEERVLLRNEHQRQFSGDEQRSAMMRLAPGVEAMTLRFYGSGQWQDDWDAGLNGLPELVEVQLILGSDREYPQPFMTTFQLPEVRLQ